MSLKGRAILGELRWGNLPAGGFEMDLAGHRWLFRR